MIRRKVSNGLLRAATQVQSASGSTASTGASVAHAVHASPMQQQTANLASSVLLSSQRNWKGETVNTLKSELKKRGLSQSGNKATLVARLSSAETSQLLPPMPSARTLSTSQARSAPPKKSASPSAPTSASASTTPTKADDTATRSSEKEMTTGPEISSKRAEAEAFDRPTAEQVTAAPGLPESGKVEPSSGERLSVKMPGPPAEDAKDQVIPLTPDNFRSNNQIPEAQQDASPDDVPSPKVMTVASASTHLSGGPVSAVHESSDSASYEASADAGGGGTADLAPNFEGAGKALASAVNSLTGVGKTAGEFSRVLIPQIGLPKSTSNNGGGQGSQGEYKPPSGGLNDEERRGVWVLGGIVGAGLLLGGLGSRDSKNGLKSKVGGAVDAVTAKGAGGPKGDAEWAKASGAGVVGHGSRKE